MAQNALVLQSVGTPIRLEQRPIPQPGEHQALLKVTAASLNPHDASVRDVGMLYQEGSPTILAIDVAGEIIKLGSGPVATSFSVGEHIFGQANLAENHTIVADNGGLQEYALMDVRYAARVAATGVSADEAVTFPANIVPVWIAFFHPSYFGLPAPYQKTADFSSTTLLVVGGGSHVGRFAVQVAKMIGVGRIVAVAGKSRENKLKDMGATHVVDRHAKDVLSQVRAIVGDDLQFAIDTVHFGARAQMLGVAALSNSKRGTLVTLLPSGPDPDGFTVEEIGSKTAGYDRKFVPGSSNFHPEFADEFWKHLPAMIKERSLLPSEFEVIEGLDAVKVNEAPDGYSKGEQKIKVNVHP